MNFSWGLFIQIIISNNIDTGIKTFSRVYSLHFIFGIFCGTYYEMFEVGTTVPQLQLFCHCSPVSEINKFIPKIQGKQKKMHFGMGFVFIL